MNVAVTWFADPDALPGFIKNDGSIGSSMVPRTNKLGLVLYLFVLEIKYEIIKVVI